MSQYELNDYDRQDLGLNLYDKAVMALAECKAVDEVKDIVDKAVAMQAYARMAKDKTLEVDAAEIRIRAERRLGEMIRAQKETVGLNTGRAGLAPIAVDDNDRDDRPTLADVGISKDLSSRAQKLAAVPEDEFEAEVSEWKDRVKEEGARVTARLEAAGARAQKKEPKPKEGPDPAQRVQELQEEVEYLKEELEETTKLLKHSQEEIESMTRIIEAEDQIAQAHAEAKRYREQVRVIQERNNGLMNQNHAVNEDAKRWMNKFLRLEKTLKAAG